MDAQGFLSTFYYSLDTVRTSVADYMSGRQADEGSAFVPLDACPADVWGSISKELTIVDVVSLARSCKSMVQAFESGHLSYGGSIAAIRLAGVDAVTPDAVVSILTRITGESTLAQPRLLRLLAMTRPGLASVAGSQMCAAWHRSLAALAVPSGAAHDVYRLAHAHWLAVFDGTKEPATRGDLESAEYDVVTAFDAFSIAEKLRYLESLAKDARATRLVFAIFQRWVPAEDERLPDVSDNVALLIAKGAFRIKSASPARPGESPEVWIRDRFNVSHSQITRVVQPFLARAIANDMRVGQDTSLMWFSTDRAFSSVIEHAYAMHLVERKAALRPICGGYRSAPLNTARVAGLMRDIIIDVEKDTIGALGSDWAAVDDFLSHRGRILKMCEDQIRRSRNKQDWHGISTLLKQNMHWAMKPALLLAFAKCTARLTLGIHLAEWLGNDIAKLSKEAVAASKQHGQPVLIVKAVLADVVAQSTFLRFKSSTVPLEPTARVDVIDRVVPRDSQLAKCDYLFAEMPPTSWAPLLAFLSELTERYPAFEDDSVWYPAIQISPINPLYEPGVLRLAAHLPAFIKTPAATVRLPSKVFADQIIRQAVTLWEEMPDCATFWRTKFDVFCLRFDLRDEALLDARHALLAAYSVRVKTGELTIEQALVRVGFYDGDARERLI